MVARAACETVARGPPSAPARRPPVLRRRPRRDGSAPSSGALAGGVDLFQLRDKDADRRRAAGRGRDRARALRRRRRALRAQRPPRPRGRRRRRRRARRPGRRARRSRARKLVGDDAIVGLSTHSMQQAQAGGRSGADYIAVGPVHATPTKAGRPGDRRRADRATPPRTSSVPWFAIGGIDAGNVGAVVKAGARRIVVVRAIAEADDPEAAARALRAAVERGRRGVGAAASGAPAPSRRSRRRRRASPSGGSHAPRLRARRGAQRRGPRAARAARARRAPARARGRGRRRRAARRRQPRRAARPASTCEGKEPGAFGVAALRAVMLVAAWRHVAARATGPCSASRRCSAIIARHRRARRCSSPPTSLAVVLCVRDHRRRPAGCSGSSSA